VGYHLKSRFCICKEGNFTFANFNSLSRTKKLIFDHEFFWHDIICMLIICVTNLKSKIFTQKIYSKSTNIYSYEKNFTTANFDTFPRTEKKFHRKFWHKTIYILITCVKIFKSKRSTQKKDIRNLPTYIFVRKIFTIANFDTLPRNEN